MEQTFSIPGQLPSLNEYINVERGNKFAAAKMKKTAEDKVVLCCKKLRPVTRAFISVEWTVPNKRKDRSNIRFAIKFIEDGMIRAGILSSDGWDYVLGHHDSYAVSAKNPHITVTITSPQEAKGE